MTTEDCPDCESDEKPCGNGHLYIKEFGPGYIERFPHKGEYKACLYVGSTGETVMQRHEKNWTKYNSPNAKHIRNFCDRYNPTHRYDLITKDIFRNPIALNQSDPGKLVRYEKKLKKNLENRGYWVEGPSGNSS
jgi:hypothetical protein